DLPSPICRTILVAAAACLGRGPPPGTAHVDHPGERGRRKWERLAAVAWPVPRWRLDREQLAHGLARARTTGAVARQRRGRLLVAGRGAGASLYTDPGRRPGDGPVSERRDGRGGLAAPLWRQVSRPSRFRAALDAHCRGRLRLHGRRHGPAALPG